MSTSRRTSRLLPRILFMLPLGGSGVAVALLLFTAPLVAANAQNVDNIGTEFFVGFMPNEREDRTRTELHLTGDVTTDVTIEYPALDPTFNQTVTVDSGAVTIVDLGAHPAFAWTPGAVDSNVVRVFSENPFVLYAANIQDASTDVAVALPVDALGTRYIVQSYTQHYENSAFAVVAIHEGTTVTVTPTRALQGGHGPGIPIQLVLDRGEGFLGLSLGDSLTNDGDLTGTLIEADLPVQVSNGHTCSPVPDPGGSCDHLFEVAQPVQSWGLEAIAVPVPHPPQGSQYRVLAAEDNTTLQLNGVAVATLDRGEYHQTGVVAGPQVFTGDKPIFVTQFLHTIEASLGDPSMMSVLPVEQYHQRYTFSTVGERQFRDDYVSVLAADADVTAGTVTLDGAPIAPSEFTSVAGTGYSYAILPIADGTHATSSSGRHSVAVMGFDPFDTYIYHGGTRYDLSLVNTAVAEAPVRAFELSGNYPNPFRESTRLAFRLDLGMHVSLTIHDVLGRHVATLANTYLPAGTHSVEWDGRDAAGRPVPSGTYLQRLDAGGRSVTGRMIVIR